MWLQAVAHPQGVKLLMVVAGVMRYLVYFLWSLFWEERLMETARLRQVLKAAVRLGILRRCAVRQALKSENPLRWLRERGRGR